MHTVHRERRRLGQPVGRQPVQRQSGPLGQRGGRLRVQPRRAERAVQPDQPRHADAGQPVAGHAAHPARVRVRVPDGRAHAAGGGGAHQAPSAGRHQPARHKQPAQREPADGRRQQQVPSEGTKRSENQCRPTATAVRTTPQQQGAARHQRDVAHVGRARSDCTHCRDTRSIICHNVYFFF